MKKTYHIPFERVSTGVYIIQAESKEAALELLDKRKELTEAEYKKCISYRFYKVAINFKKKLIKLAPDE